MFSDQFNDYKWIKVKRYIKDESLSVEEQLKILEDHHIKETAFLINKVKELAKKIDYLQINLKEEWTE